MRRVAMAVLLLALPGCAGPRAPLEIDGKAIPVDVVLGGPSAPARPPGANPGPIGFPGFIQPPVPRPQPGLIPPPPRPPGPCPIADPLDAAELVARASAPLPPVPATYTFRNQGAFRVGAAAETGYPPTSARTVGAPRALTEQGNYEFDVTIPLAGTTTTTTYRVLNAGTSPDRGIYLSAIMTESSDGHDVFQPDTPILLMPFPPPELGTNLEDEIAALRGREYRSAGTDPLTQTTMVLEARIADTKTRVDACGEWVDAWDIEVLDGRILGPLKQIAFTGRYAIATQYGALVVSDEIEVSGREKLEPVSSRNRARISTVPKTPS